MISDFLKPPTDNLYKFMCISGLILVLLSLTVPPWLVNKLAHSHLENRRDLELLQVDSDITDKRGELLTQQVETLNKERKLLLGQLENTQGDPALKSPLTAANELRLKSHLEFLKTLQDELEKKDKEWLEKMMAVLSARAEQRKKLIEIKQKNEASLWDARSAVAISIMALLTGLSGFFLCRKGFNLWSRRVQVYQDIVLKKQAKEGVK